MRSKDEVTKYQVDRIFSDPTKNMYEKVAYSLGLANCVRIGCGSIEVKPHGTLTPDEQAVEGVISFDYIVKSGWGLVSLDDVTMMLSTPEINLDTCTDEEAEQFLDLMDKLQHMATQLFICTLPEAVKTERETDKLCDWLTTKDIQILRETLEPVKQIKGMNTIFKALDGAAYELSLHKSKRKCDVLPHKYGLNLLFSGTVPLWVREAFSFDPSIKFQEQEMAQESGKEPMDINELDVALHSYSGTLTPIIKVLDYNETLTDSERIMHTAANKARTKRGTVITFGRSDHNGQ